MMQSLITAVGEVQKINPPASFNSTGHSFAASFIVWAPAIAALILLLLGKFAKAAKTMGIAVLIAAVFYGPANAVNLVYALSNSLFNTSFTSI